VRSRSKDHDDFGLIPAKIMNVIKSKSLELDAGGKPVSAFPRPALEKLFADCNMREHEKESRPRGKI
jgi:hypothetical protein